MSTISMSGSAGFNANDPIFANDPVLKQQVGLRYTQMHNFMKNKSSIKMITRLPYNAKTYVLEYVK